MTLPEIILSDANNLFTKQIKKEKMLSKSGNRRISTKPNIDLLLFSVKLKGSEKIGV